MWASATSPSTVASVGMLTDADTLARYFIRQIKYYSSVSTLRAATINLSVAQYS